MRDPLEVYPYRRLAAHPSKEFKRGSKRLLPLPLRTAVLPAVAVMLLAFCLGRAPILSELYPFGPALVGALGVQAPALVWPAVLAAGLGLTGPLGMGDLAWWSRVFSLGLLAFGISLYPPRGRWWQAPALTAGSILLARGLIYVLGGGALYESVAISFEAAFAAGLTLALIAVYPWPGRGASEEQWLCLGLAGLGILAGLQGLRLGPLDLAGATGKLAMLVAGLLGGGGGGAAAGALVSLFPLLAGFPAEAAPASLALAGLLAGSLRGLRRPGILAGLILGILIFSVYQPGRQPVLASLAEAAAAGFVFLLLPAGLLTRLPGGTKEAPMPEPLLQGRLMDTGVALQELAAALEAVRQQPEAAAKASPRRLLEGVAVRVCRGCTLFPVCWEKDFYRTREALNEMVRAVQQKPQVEGHELPVVFQQRCSRTREMCVAVGYLLENLRREDGWRSERLEFVALLGAQLQASGDAFARLAQELEQSSNMPRAAYRVHYAVAQRPAPGQEVNGDTMDALVLPEGRQAFLLSDGMGSGPAACQHSRTALSLAGRMLAAGFAWTLLVRLLNLVLLESSGQEEFFATLDLAVLDLSAGQVELIKVGAAPTLLASPAGVRIIQGNSLPAGIVREAESCHSTHQLGHGDVLVLLSDGLLGENGEAAERRLANRLAQVARAAPQEIAAALLEEGLRGGREDDASVLVARLEAVGPGGIFFSPPGMLDLENATNGQETAIRQRRT